MDLGGPLPLLLVAAYVGVQLVVGLRHGARVQAAEEYFVAGRSLAMWPAAVSVFAVWFGAETLMGASAAIAAGGMAGARAEPFGFALSLFAMGFLIAGALRARGHATLADYFRDRFGPAAETLAALAIMVGSVVWAAAQLTALAEILATIAGIPRLLSLLLGLGVILGYTAMAGMMGSVAVAGVQALVLLAGVGGLLVAVAGRFGGFGDMLAAIQPAQLNLLAVDGHWLDRIDSWFIPILGGIVTQEALGRLLATRSPAVAQQACYVAGGLYLLVGLVPLVIALAGRHLPLEGWEGDNFLPVLVMQTLPPAFALLFLAALVSAILSTVSANVLAISSVFTLNLMAGRLRRMTEARRLWVGRAATIIAGLVALLFAASGTSIYNLLLLSIVLGQGGLLVAVLMGLYTRIGGPLSGLSAILANMACNLGTLILWPLAVMEAPGATPFERLVMIVDGEGPAVPGTFLLSLAASAIAYVLAGFARPRTKVLAA